MISMLPRLPEGTEARILDEKVETHPFGFLNIKIWQCYVAKSAQEHYENFHKKFNSCTRVFTLSGQKLVSMGEQAHNFCMCQEDFCGVGVSWKHL